MPRKIFIITIILAIIIVLALFILPNITFNGKKTTEYLPETIQNIFPGVNSPRNIGERSTQNNINKEGASQNQNEENTASSTKSERIIPLLQKIYNKPVAGSIILEREKEYIENKIKKTRTEHFVRFVDRATGHVLETNLETGENKKISNTTIPKIYEVYFDDTGNYFIGRFLNEDGETIKTYGISLEEKKVSTTTATTTKEYEAKITENFEDNILDLSVSSDRKNIIYSKILNDKFSLISSSIKRVSPKEIWESPLKEWQIHFGNNTSALVSSKPTAIAQGFAYFINKSNGRLTKATQGETGLTLLPSRNLEYALFGKGGDSLSMRVEKVSSGENFLTVQTIPEKCIWGRKNQKQIICGAPKSVPVSDYPDVWYQGRILWDDIIWKIDVENGTSNIVVDPTNYSGESIDLINPETSSDDVFMSFINKRDLNLWALYLEENQETEKATE